MPAAPRLVVLSLSGLFRPFRPNLANGILNSKRFCCCCCSRSSCGPRPRLLQRSVAVFCCSWTCECAMHTDMSEFQFTLNQHRSNECITDLRDWIMHETHLCACVSLESLQLNSGLGHSFIQGWPCCGAV